MKFQSRHIALTIVLISFSLFGRWFYGETLSYLLLLAAVVLGLFQIYTVNRHLKKLAYRFLGKENKSAAEATSGAIALLQAKEEQIKKIITAITKVQEGVLDESLIQLEGEEGTAIHNLQDKLRLMKEEEARQGWMVKGIAQMGEIRKSNASLDDYGYQVICTLVKYLEVNQGVFYLLTAENKEKRLEQLASYAYGKRKYTVDKVVIDAGNGLLGQCVLEKDIIFLKQVPKNYLKITSGLGEATPRCIIISPLIFREEVFGVIEMASFQILENHQLSFIKKVSEGIAAELADVLRQEKTAKLLEQSQQNANELRNREEELRQNMEEMAATQEEMETVRDRMNAQLKVLDKVTIISKTDQAGNIIYVNEMFIENTQYTREELIGKNHRILKSSNTPEKVYEEMWATITSGKIWSGELENRAKDGTPRWVDTTIAPLFNSKGEIIEYLSARFPIDERKKREEEMKVKEVELQKQLRQVLVERKKNQAILEGCVDGVISFDDQGIVQFFNHSAEEIFGYSRAELLFHPITEILDLIIVEDHNNKADKHLITPTGNQINIRTEVNAKDKSGNEISLLLTGTKVKVEEGILFTLFAQKISVDLF